MSYEMDRAEPFLAAHVFEKNQNLGGLGQWTGHGRGHPLGGVSVRPFVRFR